MAQLQQSVDIARPMEEVFAFVANPANDARWGSTLVEVQPVSPGPLEVGSRFRYVARFVGRRLSWCAR
jgi:polyketide cyclase/dehydrase/lipid transport protein